MSTAASNVHRNDFAEKKSGILSTVQAASVSRPQLPAEAHDMSPRTRKIVYLFLLAGVLFLGSLTAYVWWGVFQLQKIR